MKTSARTLLMLLSLLCLAYKPVAAQLSADTDGDGKIDVITVVTNGIQIVHGGTGITKLYPYSNVNFSLRSINDTDGVPGDEIIVTWTGGGDSNGIHVIHDRTGTTNGYPQNRQFSITKYVSDTDGEPGSEIIVIWTGATADVNGIQVIHDRTGATKNYQQNRQFGISFVSDTDGEAGNEIIVYWAGEAPNNGIQVIHDKTGSTNNYQQDRQFSINSVSDTDGEAGNEIIVIWAREFPYNGIDVIHDRTKTTNNYPQNTTFSIGDVRDYDGVSGAEICISWPSGSSKLYAVIVDRTRKTIRTSGCDIVNQADRSFTTHQSGDWSDSLTWEEYIPNIGKIYPASQIPNIGHGWIRINAGHVVDIRSFDVTAKRLTVVGTLQVAGTLQVSMTLDVNGTLINNGTTQIYGTVQINQGGAVSGNDFVYTGLSSSLEFNGTNSIDSENALWPSTNGPANVTVLYGASVMLNTARTVSGSLQVSGALQVAGALQVDGTLQINGISGTLTNNGMTQISGTVAINGTGARAIGNDFVYTGCCSRLELQKGTHSIDNENAFWPSTNGPAKTIVQKNASVTLNVARTVSDTLEVSGTFQVADTLITNGATQIAGTFQINQGGAVSGNNFVYTKASNKLVLNGVCSIDSGNVFWPRQNGPANVTISRYINVTLNAARAVSGVLQIDGTLQVVDTLTTNKASGVTLQVDGTLIANGTTNVWTLIVTGTLTNNGTMENSWCRLSGLLTNNGTTRSGGPYQVAGTLINNGTMQIEQIFLLDQGGVVNGNDFIYGEYGTLIFNSSNSYDVTSESVYWPSTNGPVDVKVQGAGGITMNVARAVNRFETAGSVRNASNLTVSGSVSINAGGAFDSSPIYSGAATLIYNTGDLYNVSGEWGSGTSVGSGVPKNVVIYPGTTVIMPSSPRKCPGDLHNSGTGDPHKFGTLVLSTTPGADLSVGGDWTNGGTFLANSRVVIFNGTTEQTIEGRVNAFDNLIVNNPAGILVQGQAGGSEVREVITSVTVHQTLTFTAGNIRLRLALLTLSDSVSGPSINRHVVTYNRGRVVRSIAGGGSFQFPIGPTETSYNPLTIALAPGDTTETFSVRVDSTMDLGALDDSLFVQRTWDIQEATLGGNHAALTFQWAGAEEGAKFIRNASSTYLDGIELVRNSVAAGTDPYIVNTTGGLPCTKFSRYTVGTSGAVAVEESKNGIPASYILGQNYPNPFNPSTTIRYAIPQAGEVTLKVYNLVGEEIETLVNEKQPAGEHTLRWNPVGLPSGVYLYRLEAEGFAQTKKLLLMK